MTETTNMRLRFERFAEAGEKHAFRLRSGQNFEGWVVDVGEDAVFVLWASSPFYAQATGTDKMSPPDEWIRFEDIDLASLGYWDDTARRWIDFAYAEPDAAPDP